MKKIIILSAVLAASVVAGCSASSSSTATPPTTTAAADPVSSSSSSSGVAPGAPGCPEPPSGYDIQQQLEYEQACGAWIGRVQYQISQGTDQENLGNPATIADEWCRAEPVPGTSSGIASGESPDPMSKLAPACRAGVAAAGGPAANQQSGPLAFPSNGVTPADPHCDHPPAGYSAAQAQEYASACKQWVGQVASMMENDPDSPGQIVNDWCDTTSGAPDNGGPGDPLMQACRAGVAAAGGPPANAPLDNGASP